MKLQFPKVSGYSLVMQLGGGGFSTVYRAVNFDTREVAACKVVTLTLETTAQERKTFDKEMRIHQALKHENILEFKTAVIVEPNEPKLRYYPGLYMLLELAAGGDLFDKIAPDIGVGEDISHVYLLQLIAGLQYIHDQGVCHRDLKPENLLLDAAGTLKISDFGLCAVYKVKESGKMRMLSERCGSLPYLAPELLREAPYEAEPVDVWGGGVILYALLSGNTPWDEPTKHSHEYARYLTGECFDQAPWNRFSRDLLSLLTGMLAIDPSRRMSLNEVAAHPWMIRPSQLAKKGLAVLAEHLTESLRQTGDLEIATPDITKNVDADGDQIMGTASHNSQFTQTLMLFSQTKSGRRYSPHLTRFYAQLLPHMMLPLIQEALTELGVKWKPAQEVVLEEAGEEIKILRMRIGGYDRRRLQYKGWVELEHFKAPGAEGTYCVMARDQGNPISWRLLWKAVIMDPVVEPHVYRERDGQ
ncbi:CAMK/CAMKL/CHK1 protein kinase [Fomitopsis serialis]|uniref:CAMK/CAMKL/CHK1 protein kinase n=1 Tax=Fomitopsis serialis TaxID=139415 RepID=UPI00200805AD|nr:CAMK/CAMKL/CHK1 protein kinase [Neoantrodia serialis]KAH9923815.1 CAMK/CAMKL/CHK1 protein kinase [Neoantrodia serialis]